MSERLFKEKNQKEVSETPPVSGRRIVAAIEVNEKSWVIHVSLGLPDFDQINFPEEFLFKSPMSVEIYLQDCLDKGWSKVCDLPATTITDRDGQQIPIPRTIFLSGVVPNKEGPSFWDKVTLQDKRPKES